MARRERVSIRIDAEDRGASRTFRGIARDIDLATEHFKQGRIGMVRYTTALETARDHARDLINQGVKPLGDEQKALNRIQRETGGKIKEQAGLLETLRKNWVAVTAVVVGAVYAMRRAARGFVELAQRGGQVLELQRAFNNLFPEGTEALDQMRQATFGLIPSFDLMQKANQAAILGAARTSDAFSDLAQKAILLGRAQGVDALESVDALLTGIARQSRRMLDNIGIVVDAQTAYERYADAHDLVASALSETQRQEAFMAEALRQADVAIQNTGQAVFNNADRWERLASRISNARDRLAEMVATSPNVARFFSAMETAIDALIPKVEKLAGFMGDLASHIMGGPAAAVENALMAGFEGAVDPEDFIATVEAVQGERVNRVSELRAARERLEGRTPPRIPVGGTAAERAAAARANRQLAAQQVDEETGPSLAQVREELDQLAPVVRGTRAALDRMRERVGARTTAPSPPRLPQQTRTTSVAIPLPGQGLAGVTPTLPGVDTTLSGPLFTPRDPEGRDRALLQGVRDVGITSMQEFGALDPEQQSAIRDALANTGQTLEDLLTDTGEAARSMEPAIMAGVGAFQAIGLAAIRGSEDIEQVLIPSIANIAAAAVGGPWGAVIGAAGSLVAAALAGGGNDKPRVIVDDYGPAAERKMRQDSDTFRQTVVFGDDLATEEQLRQLGYQLNRIDRRRGGTRGVG